MDDPPLPSEQFAIIRDQILTHLADGPKMWESFYSLKLDHQRGWFADGGRVLWVMRSRREIDVEQGGPFIVFHLVTTMTDDVILRPHYDSTEHDVLISLDGETIDDLREWLDQPEDDDVLISRKCRSGLSRFYDALGDVQALHWTRTTTHES